MPNDPFYGPQTTGGKIRKQLIVVWPSIYNFINHFFNATVTVLKEIFVSVYQSLKG